MVETPSALSPSSPRKPRLLWACPWCLLDTSSGASISARQMLLQLVEQGYEVAILGATIFDAEKGVLRLREHWEAIETNRKKFIKINDGPLTHTLLVTKSTVRNDMTAEEEGLWYGGYVSVLNDFKPDLVWFYGGQTLDMLIPDEARMRGIPSVAYLVNGNYQATRWCRDVDLIVTDTQATADLYKETQGFTPVAIGAFIEPSKVIAPEHRRERVLFVNPSFAKGVGIVVQLALLLRDRRPDILFEVVESRGDWPEAVKMVSASMGQPCEVLENVILTPNTDDMRPIYGRARILLAPSLWWESGARVLAEAMLNAIPAIVTDRGGSPEMIQNGGIKLVLPENCHASPYTTVPALELLQPLVDKIIQLYDDEVEYEKYVARARAVGQNRHALAVSTGRLLQTFAPLIQKRAGDGVQPASAGKESKQVVIAPENKESTWLEICQRFEMFRPNSAGWTGGLRALAELTEQSAKGTISGLDRLAVRCGMQRDLVIEDVSALPQDELSRQQVERLAALFVAHGSDKATAHNYHLFYGWILARVGDEPRIFEIGLGSNNVDTPSNMGARGRPGASLRAFRDAFDKAEIYGADVDQRILFEEKRIRTHFVDQTDPASFTALQQWLPGQLDLLIDDGLHAPNANLNTLLFGLDQIKPGGWIVVEDILEPMLPIWRVVALMLPDTYSPKIIRTKSAYLFAVQRLSA